MLKRTYLIRLSVLAVILVTNVLFVMLSIPRTEAPTVPTLAQLPTEAGAAAEDEQPQALAAPADALPTRLSARLDAPADVPVSQDVVLNSAQSERQRPTAAPVEFVRPNALPTALPFPTLVQFATQAAPDVFVPLPEAPVPNQLVITFQPDTSAVERDAYIASIGGQVVQSIDALNTVVVTVAQSSNTLSQPVSGVLAAAEPDYFVSAQLAVPPSDPMYSQQWALPVIGVSNGWLALPANAPTVTVAVIDSGICLNHPELAGRILPGWDFVQGDSTPQDDLGHGCGVAGIIAANADNSAGIAGVAPNARILPLRVLDAQGYGTYSSVAAAVVYAADHGAQIINLSLGGIASSSVLEQAVDYAVGKGITIVAAAGNNGSSQPLYPAAYAPVISVGSVDPNLSVSTFSSGGANVDFLAPGRDILTLKPDGTYTTVTGTSFAAPHVAGVAAADIALGAALSAAANGIVTFSASAPTPPPSGTATATAPTCDSAAVDQRSAEFQALVAQREADPNSVSEAEYQAAARAYLASTDGCYDNEAPTVPIDNDGIWMLGFGPSAQYVLQGSKWGANSPYNTSSPPGTSGGTVTYSYIADGVSMYPDSSSASVALTSLPGYQACFKTEIEMAFAAWAAVADVDFVEVADNGVAFNVSGALGDIRIGAHYMDGPSNVLAHAYYPPPNGVTAAGDLHFDSSENWTCNTSGFDIGIVAVHEIGHSLGLNHSTFTSAIMYAYYNSSLNAPQADDISGIQAIYGSGGPTLTPTYSPTPPTCPSFPYTVPAGSVSNLITAITCANLSPANDVINLTNSTYTLTAINNTADEATGLPVIVSASTAGTLTINGNASTITRSSAGGTPNFRIFHLAAGANLTLNNVALNNGIVTTSEGGAVLNLGTLTLNYVTVSNNAAIEGGGIYNDDTLVMNTASVTGNTATTSYGGGVSNYGSATITGSTISGNAADISGGGIDSSGTLWLFGSTVENNSAGTDGGGYSNYNGTLFMLGSTFAGNTASVGAGISQISSGSEAVVTNSTLYGNAAASGLGGAVYNTAGTVIITNSTLSGNTGSTGAGVYNGGTVMLRNAIVANSTGSDCYSSSAPTVTNTLIEDGSCTASSGGTNLMGDPNLGVLSGLPLYYPLNTGSPAINAGDSSLLVEGTSLIDYNGDGDLSDTLTTDQAAEARVVGASVDMGSVEFVPANTPPTISDITDKETNRSTPIVVNFTVGDAETSPAALTLTGTSSNQTLVPDANIVFGGSGANRSATITPALDQLGSATITICVTDAGSLSACDDFVLSVIVPPDAIFSDGFESANLSAWTSKNNDGGDLSVSSSARLMGSYGLRALIDDTTPIFVTDDTPNAEGRYRARFLFDPNTLTMANGDNFNLFVGFQGTSTQVVQVQMRRSGSAYQVRVAAVDDGTTWSYSPFVTITDVPHLLEIDWQAATSGGANNGALAWWLDEGAQTGISGIDNDTRRVDRARLGAAAGIDAGTSGTLFFDAFISRRSTYIGYLVPSPALVSPADGALIGREVAPNLTWNTAAGATEYYVEFTNGTTVNMNSGWQAGTTWSPGTRPQGVYTWRVKARNAGGEESGWSTRTLTIRPGVPSNLQGTAVNATTVNLSWTASVDAPAGITLYRVFRDDVEIGTTNNTTTTFTDTAAAFCAANDYYVRAVNGSVESLDSNTVTVNTACDPIFSDGFESGNLSAWSGKSIDGGDLAVIASAQQTSSSYGMRARINDVNELYVQDDTPNAEGRYRARFYFDPNTVTMANGDRFTIFSAYHGVSLAQIVQIEMRKSGTAYQLRAGLRDDAANWTYTSYFTITDAPHIVEIDWQAATAGGANNGSLAFWIDESLMQTLSSIDNDTRRVDTVRLGAVTGLDAGTTGVVYFDAFRSTRTSYIGAEIGGLSMIFEPEATETPTVEPTVEPSETPSVEPTETPTPQPTLLPFSVPVFQTMDDGAPLWSASAGWLLSADAAYSGLGWQASASGNTETLALNVPVNLAGTTAPTLTFQSKLVSASLPEVQVSTDGAAWQTVSTVTPSLNWALVTVDLSAYAGQTIQLRLAWTAPAGAGETWQVDEVTLSDGIAQPPIEPTLPPVQPTFEIEPTTPNVEPPVVLPTTVPREGGTLPDAPADLPPAPAG